MSKAYALSSGDRGYGGVHILEVGHRLGTGDLAGHVRARPVRPTDGGFQIDAAKHAVRHRREKGITGAQTVDDLHSYRRDLRDATANEKRRALTTPPPAERARADSA